MLQREDVMSTNNGPTASAFTPEEITEASRYRLEIQWSDEDQAYLVTLPELEGIRSHAATVAEAAERGVELAAEYIDAMRTLGRPIPAPTPVAVGA
jgi:predicted RNase H-like HicB family nuclease